MNTQTGVSASPTCVVLLIAQTETLQTSSSVARTSSITPSRSCWAVGLARASSRVPAIRCSGQTDMNVQALKNSSLRLQCNMGSAPDWGGAAINCQNCSRQKPTPIYVMTVITYQQQGHGGCSDSQQWPCEATGNASQPLSPPLHTSTPTIQHTQGLHNHGAALQQLLGSCLILHHICQHTADVTAAGAVTEVSASVAGAMQEPGLHLQSAIARAKAHGAGTGVLQQAWQSRRCRGKGRGIHKSCSSQHVGRQASMPGQVLLVLVQVLMLVLVLSIRLMLMLMQAEQQLAHT